MMSLSRYWEDETAGTAIEYAVLTTLIAVVAYASISALGLKLFDKIQAIF